MKNLLERLIKIIFYHPERKFPPVTIRVYKYT